MGGSTISSISTSTVLRLTPLARLMLLANPHLCCNLGRFLCGFPRQKCQHVQEGRRSFINADAVPVVCSVCVCRFDTDHCRGNYQDVRLTEHSKHSAVEKTWSEVNLDDPSV